MINFWNEHNWKPVHNNQIVEDFANTIGLEEQQVQVFRQNNRKKHQTIEKE